MDMRNEIWWSKQFQGLTEGGESWNALMKQYESWRKKKDEAAVYRQKLENRVMDVWQPIRILSRSKLGHFDNEKLLKIGKLAKELSDLLRS